MTSEGLGEMFEGDFADTDGEKFPFVRETMSSVCKWGARTFYDFFS